MATYCGKNVLDMQYFVLVYMQLGMRTCFYQFLRNFLSIAKKISFNFQENFIPFYKKFHSIFKRISFNFQDNLMQFLGEFHNFQDNFTHFFKNSTQFSREFDAIFRISHNFVMASRKSSLLTLSNIFSSSQFMCRGYNQ